MQAVVDGLLTNYLRQGSGPTVVIVHGWADRADSWMAFATRLSREYDVIVPSLPGFGGTQDPPTPWGLDDYATFIAHFLKKIEAQPIAMVGHSNGGAIVIRGTAMEQFSPQKLVLISSAGVRSTDKGRKLVLKFIAKTGKLVTLPLPKAAKQKLRSRLYNTAGSDLLVAEQLEATFKKIVAQDVAQDAAKITLPTLLIYGEQDTATPVSYGRLFHEQISGSTLEVITNAGHFVHLDQPEKTLDITEKFLCR